MDPNAIGEEDVDACGTCSVELLIELTLSPMAFPFLNAVMQNQRQPSLVH